VRRVLPGGERSRSFERRHRPGPFHCTPRYRTAQGAIPARNMNPGLEVELELPKRASRRISGADRLVGGVKGGGPCLNTVSRPSWGRSTATSLNGTHQWVGWSGSRDTRANFRMARQPAGRARPIQINETANRQSIRGSCGGSEDISELTLSMGGGIIPL